MIRKRHLLFSVIAVALVSCSRKEPGITDKVSPIVDEPPPPREISQETRQIIAEYVMRTRGWDEQECGIQRLQLTAERDVLLVQYGERPSHTTIRGSGPNDITVAIDLTRMAVVAEGALQ